jgi:hypothetical protein
MKAFQLPICLPLVVLAVGGCFVPLNNSVVSEHEIGVRRGGAAAE